MQYVSLKDRIADAFSNINQRLNLTREGWYHIGIAAGIAILISAIILLTVVSGKQAYMERLDSRIETASVALAEAIDTLNDNTETESLIAAKLQIALNWIDNIREQLTTQDGRIAMVELGLTEAQCSPPEAYLTGNYTLYVKSSESGNFTANVHLVYSAPIYVGNTTTYDETLSAFYAGVNWTEACWDYIPVISFNGTAWRIKQVWFNIGTFALEANTETTLDIMVAGLNSTYEPSFAYVEVFQILRGR